MSLENDFKEVFSYSMHAGGGTNLNFETIDRRFFDGTPISRYFFEGYKLDSSIHTQQKFLANSLHILVSGEIEITYEDQEYDKVVSSYYDSPDWVSYREFWTKEKNCKIAPTQTVCLYRLKRIKTLEHASPLNDFSQLDIKVRKVSANSVSFNVSNNSILVVLNPSMQDFTLANESVVFDTSSNSEYCDILIGKDPRQIFFKNYYSFSVTGNCTFSTANSCHLVLLTPK